MLQQSTWHLRSVYLNLVEVKCYRLSLPHTVTHSCIMAGVWERCGTQNQSLRFPSALQLRLFSVVSSHLKVIGSFGGRGLVFHLQCNCVFQAFCSCLCFVQESTVGCFALWSFSVCRRSASLLHALPHAHPDLQAPANRYSVKLSTTVTAGYCICLKTLGGF